MKKTNFQDNSGNEIQISMSGGGDYRVYCTQTHTGTEVNTCLLLNKAQANILINALKDLMDEE